MPLSPPHEPYRELPASAVGDLVPVDVLDEDVVPRLFTVRNGQRQLMLAYLADEARDAEWYLLGPTSSRTVAKLQAGIVPLRDALTGAWMWLVRRGHDGLIGGWAVNEDEIPREHLPAPGVPLHLEHYAVMSTRAIGENLGARTTPASVVSWVADATRKAVKVLVDQLLELDTGGRPTDLARSLYDLPVQHLAFNSFEIGFGTPQTGDALDSVHEAVTLLQAGLDWLSAQGETVLLPDRSPDQRLAVLEALRHLSPPKHGTITSVEVGGRWIPRTGHLNTHSRRKLQREIDAIHAETPVTHVGNVRELDLDRGTFIIRDPGIRGDIRGTISSDTYEDFVKYFADEKRAAVIGVQRGSRFFATAIGPAPSDNERAS